MLLDALNSTSARYAYTFGRHAVANAIVLPWLTYRSQNTTADMEFGNELEPQGSTPKDDGSEYVLS